MTEVLIVRVLRHYFPTWEPPQASRYEWRKCLCPAHGDENASASVSYERNAFRCHACHVKGDAYSLIAEQEGISYSEAIKFATEVLGGGDVPLPQESRRFAGRRVFGDSGSVSEQPGGRKVPSRLRRRSFTRA